MTRQCTHRPRIRVTALDRTAYVCARPKCIGRAVKWALRHAGHALTETIKEER